ncbi:MAG: site-specific integrase [Chitinophagaceae bacterium]
MEQSFGLFFFLKKHRHYTNGEAHVYMRITIDGESCDISTKRKCLTSNWNSSAGRMCGKTDEIKNFNCYLDTLQQKVFEAKRKLIELDKELTVENIKDVLLGKDTDKGKYMLVEIFKRHNEQMKELVGREYAAGTLERYETSLRHTISFLQWKYKVIDIDILKIKYEFISEYEFWLKSVRKCEHNSTMKYLTNFRKIVFRCVRNGWLNKDPFSGFKMTRREVERTALTQTELDVIVAKNLSIPRLALVRDIFLFSCYTGLSYIDVKKLKRSEIIIGADKEKWIVNRRQKTRVPARIPLLSAALKIADRYSIHPQCANGDKVLPVLSNQKMNAYLKEIADLCGLSKNLTFHIARHTFATTITLSNGVPIETVSKMLGHRNITMTQHYAKILDHKISNDMKVLRSKFE